MSTSNEEILDWVATSEIISSLETVASHEELLLAVKPVYLHRRKVVMGGMKQAFLKFRENNQEPKSLVDKSLRKLGIGPEKPKREIGNVENMIPPDPTVSRNDFNRFGLAYGMPQAQVSRIEYYLKQYDSTNNHYRHSSYVRVPRLLEWPLIDDPTITPILNSMHDWRIDMPALEETLLTDRMIDAEGFGNVSVDMLYCLTEEWLKVNEQARSSGPSSSTPQSL
jgi:hypothetical protein